MFLHSRSAWLPAVGLILVLAATAAQAHVTVAPKQSPLGAREKYVMRVPNEKASPTVRIEGEFPPTLKVTSFEDKPGWTVEPRRDASGAITGAVWTGSLPVDGFTEFGILAVNPKAGQALTWRFTQVYGDGARVEWSGPKGSKNPAPVVTLVPAPAE